MRIYDPGISSTKHEMGLQFLQYKRLCKTPLCTPIEIEQREREPEEKRASEMEIGETTLEYLEQVVTCCISSGDLILAGIGKKHMWWV